MSLEFFKPEDNGGSEISSYELYINDGNDANEPLTKVVSYTDNSMTHTLDVTTDSLTTGLIYKLMFRATNAIGTSEDSASVRYALVDVPVMPSAPTVLYTFSNET